MSKKYCPYCSGIKGGTLGDIYCSLQHEINMAELNTGTLYIKAKLLEETYEHVSRLSIRCMLNGEQHYKVNGNDHLVKPGNYLIVNQGQYYKTSFESDKHLEMILVAFKPGLVENLLYSLTTPADILLENPFDANTDKVYLFEKTYKQDETIQNIFSYLRSLIDVDAELKKEIDFESIYEALLTRILEIQLGLHEEIDKLQTVKSSTRIELYRRLSIAKDFIDANLSQKILVSDISKAACLSMHHFKREFKALYGCTPHQYVFSKRMEKAKALLINQSSAIQDVCLLCGFENTSSFIRQFKRYASITPGSYKLRAGKATHAPGS